MNPKLQPGIDTPVANRQRDHVRGLGVHSPAQEQQLPGAAAEPSVTPLSRHCRPSHGGRDVKLHLNKINVGEGEEKGRRWRRQTGKERARQSERAAVAIFPIFTLLRRVQLLGPLRSNQTSGDGRKILPLSHEVLFEKEYLLFARICSHFIWIHLFFKVKEGGGGVGEDKGGGRRGGGVKKNQPTNKQTNNGGGRGEEGGRGRRKYKKGRRSIEQSVFVHHIVLDVM